MTRVAPLLERDLAEILERGEGDFERLRGARIFITGGTGFVGSWLLESLRYANGRLALGIRAFVLTRDPAAFARAAPHVAADPMFDFVRGDVHDLGGVSGAFDAIVHAATPASAKINDEQPFVMIDTVVDGTRRVLELARGSGAIPLLLTSSGAVYGKQPPELELVGEAYAGGPDPLEPRNAYHESKRLAELLCVTAASGGALLPKIARLFAFVGPYLPLDRHFAVGNFVRDALASKTIEILGDGTPVRTYLYAADMASWLWRILTLAPPGRAYNVGSEHCRTIAETARVVGACVEPPANVVVCVRPDASARLPDRYACSTQRARNELDLYEWTPFEEAVRRTLSWYRTRGTVTV